MRLTLTDFARCTGLDKATLLRLLGVLMQARMVQRDDNGRYALGPAVLHLGMLYRRTFDLGARLQPVLQALVEATDETVAFYVRSGDERVCLYRQNSPREVRPHVEPGMRLPLSAGGASAHILLHYGGDETRYAAQIERDGYVMTRSERVTEMASIALPVFDPDDGFLGAIVIIGLASRHSLAAQLRGKDEACRLLAFHGFMARPPRQPLPVAIETGAAATPLR